MELYVRADARQDGDGSSVRPFRSISEAAAVAGPGDEVLVAPGIYREAVDPVHAGLPDQRIIYRAQKPGTAVITGAEPVKAPGSCVSGLPKRIPKKSCCFPLFSPLPLLFIH